MPNAGREACVVKYAREEITPFLSRGVLKRDSISREHVVRRAQHARARLVNLLVA